MSQENTVQVGINLDIIYTSIKYYAIIGAGIGILGIILLNQFGGGGGIAGGIIGGFLSVVILSYSVLTAPIIAAFVGYILDQQMNNEPRTKVINSAIANGVGYIVFGLVVGLLLSIGVALILGGDGGASMGGSSAADGGTTSGGGSSLVGIPNIITLIALMMVPNALIGGGITAISDSTSLKSGDMEAQSSSKNNMPQTNEPIENTDKSDINYPDIDIPLEYVKIFVLIALITAVSVPVIEYATASGEDLTASGGLRFQPDGYGTTVEVVNPTNKEISTKIKTELIIEEEITGTQSQAITVPADSTKEVSFDVVSSNLITLEDIEAINRGDFELRYTAEGNVIGTSTELPGSTINN